MQNILAIFNELKSERSAAFKAQHDLIIKTGEGLGAVILKMLKPSWTTDDHSEVLNSNGLFFGTWVDADCEARGIVRYNVHAKKLRAIKGEAFAAREFARSFRAQCKDDLTGWPQWSYPKGPITLFQGEYPLDVKTIKAETALLMDRFAALAPKLENLLNP